MTRVVRRFIVLAALGVAAVLHAQAPRTGRFRFERPVLIAAPGAQRLPIDLPLLAGGAPFRAVAIAPGRAIAQGGLSDLRLFDPSGAEVGYLLLQSPAQQAFWAPGDVLPVAPTQKASGFEADLHAARTIDAVRVQGIAPPFLKRLTVEGSGDREHWTLLVPEGTLFDLPDEGLRETDLMFPAGAYRYLRITWNDANSGRVGLPAAVAARTVTGGTPPPTLTAQLGAERRPSEPGRSRYRVKLPAPNLPIVAVDVDADGGHVFRDAAVYESQLSGGEAVPSELGRATLRRALRDGMAAGLLRIPLARQPSEATLDVVIEDGANPPLDVRGVTIVFAELPWIYFEPQRGPLVARYGDPSATAPTYDLEAVRETVKVMDLREATWGPPRAIESTGIALPASAMPDTGASIEASTFAYSRTMTGSDGLSAVTLDAAVLAHSRGPAARFADVRIIDGSKRQVPYVLERRDEPLSIDVPVEPVHSAAPELTSSQGHNRSAYALALPYGNLPQARIVVETSGRVFQRPVQLGVERPPDRRRRNTWFDVFDTTVWSHSDLQTAPVPVSLAVRQGPDTRLVFTVDEGDNSPLPITRARLLLPTYRLRFYSPGAVPLQMVYGRDDIPAPRYDITLLAPQVMGGDAREVALGPETGRGTAPSATFVSPKVFWALLIVAIAILVAIIVKLLRT